MTRLPSLLPHEQELRNKNDLVAALKRFSSLKSVFIAMLLRFDKSSRQMPDLLWQTYRFFNALKRVRRIFLGVDLDLRSITLTPPPANLLLTETQEALPTVQRDTLAKAKLAELKAFVIPFGKVCNVSAESDLFVWSTLR